MTQYGDQGESGYHVRGGIHPRRGGAPRTHPRQPLAPPRRHHHGRQRPLGDVARPAPRRRARRGREGRAQYRASRRRDRRRVPHPLRLLLGELESAAPRGLHAHEPARALDRSRAARADAAQRSLPRDRRCDATSRPRGAGGPYRSRRDRRGAGRPRALHRRRARSRPAHPHERGDARVELSPVADRLHRVVGDAHALARLRGARPLPRRRGLPAAESALRAGVMSEARGVPMPAPVEAHTGSRVGELGRRVLSIAVLLPFFVWVLVAAPSWIFTVVVVGVGLLGNWEFSRMFARAGVPVLRDAGLVWGGLVTLAFLRPERAGAAFALVVVGLLVASLDGGPAGPARWQRVAVTLLGVCYVNWLLGHVLWLRALPDGLHWVLLLVWITWVGETAAYVVGSLIGRHKLAPEISPGKTVEGALAQFIASVLAAVTAGGWLFPGLQLRDALVVGVLLGLLGQVGDLTESALKRSVGTKDTGQVIPGHGGILDRIDGLLFNAPALFYYVTYGRALHA